MDTVTNVPELGRCSAQVVHNRFSSRLLKIFCESPRTIPAASIRLRHEPTGQVWLQRLNSSVTYNPGPYRTWWASLDRAQSFFHLSESEISGPGTQWLVPAAYLSASRIEITAEIHAGRSVVHFQLPKVNLDDKTDR
ncbi:MAG: hypothetical protein FJW20_26495 [Acidimicrobiia bacterium]|nr:hypothetical protein [Acidimicrobiia bacterium]